MDLTIGRAAATAPPLTDEQKAALGRLHAVSQQFEGVFLGMMLKSMRETVPKDTIFGKESSAEGMFQDMLDQERSNSLAQSGSVGIASMLESQLRASVLANPGTESKVQIPRSTIL